MFATLLPGDRKFTMLSCYQKLPQNLEKDFHGTNGDVGLVMNQIRREFHKSLDLNHPMCSRPLLEWQHIFDKEIGVRCLMRPQRAKRRCLMKMKVEQEERNKSLDLKLRLSQPGLHLQDVESSNQAGTLSLSTSSQCSCMSLDKNSSSSSIESFDNTNIIEVPTSLVLMGCTHCHIYVMVSEIDPKCPKCKRTVLIGKFCQKPAKKCRKS